jgi:hypothetical protein
MVVEYSLPLLRPALSGFGLPLPQYNAGLAFCHLLLVVAYQKIETCSADLIVDQRGGAYSAHR